MNENFAFAIIASLLFCSAVAVWLVGGEYGDDAFWGLYISQPIERQTGPTYDLGPLSGYYSLLIIMSIVTDQSVSLLPRLPITGILIPVLIYILARRMTSRPEAAVWATLIAGLNVQRDLYSFNVQVFGFAYVFLLAIMIFMRARDFDRGRPTAIVVLLMVAAVFTYHTGGAWLLVVITFHHMMRWLDGQSSSVAFVEIGAAAILFFGFTDNAYTGVPQLLANASFQEGFAKVFVPLAPFLHQKLAANPYAYYRPLLNPLGILKISFLVLFGSAILWHVLAAARRRSMSHLPPAMLAILALAAADMIAYLALGQFNLRVLMFFGPVVAACLLFNQARRLTAPRIGATIGVILAAAIMVGSVATRDLNEVQLDDVGPAASFLHAQSDAIIVTDLRTLNKLVQSEPRLHVRDFNQGIYASLLAEGGGGDWPRPAIFAYNLRTEELPLVAGVFEWTQYRPLLRNDISSPALNAIYDDGRVVAFDHLPHRATREV